MSAYTNFSTLLNNKTTTSSPEFELKFNVSIDDEVKSWIDLDLSIPRGVLERLDLVREQQRIQKEAEEAKRSVEIASDWMPDEVCKVCAYVLSGISRY